MSAVALVLDLDLAPGGLETKLREYFGALLADLGFSEMAELPFRASPRVARKHTKARLHAHAAKKTAVAKTSDWGCELRELTPAEVAEWDRARAARRAAEHQYREPRWLDRSQRTRF